MTWPRVIATGSGKTEYRLEFEGLKRVWCTTSAMVKTAADGREWCVGLHRSGLKIREDGDLPRASLKLGSMQVVITDIGGKATDEFARKPTKTSYLTADFDIGATDMFVSAGTAAGWGDGDILYLNTETMRISTAGVTLEVNDRAIWGSREQKHWTEDGEVLRMPEINDRPVVIEGRIATLYAYGDGDSLTGDGTQIWRGVVATEPRLENGTDWTITLDPLTRVFQQDIGADIKEPVMPRGITYPWNAAPTFRVSLHSGTDAESSVTSYFFVTPMGHWETQAEYVAALNVILAAGSSGWATSITAEAIDQHAYRFVATTGAGGLYVSVVPDSDWRTWVEASDWEWFDATMGGGRARVFVATRTYHLTMDAPVPRGMFGNWSRGYITPDDATNADLYPSHKVYLGGTTVVDSNTTASLVDWSAARTDDGSAAGPATHYIESVDAAARSIVLSNEGGLRPMTFRAPNLPRITLGRVYGDGLAGENLYGFLNALITSSPSYCNIGASPLITDADIDILTPASVQNPVNEAERGREWLTHRRYATFGRRALWEWIAHECMLRGLFPCLTSNGKLRFRALRIPTATDVSVATVDASKTLVDGGLPTWERSAYGLINTVVIRTGYDAHEDKHVGNTYVVRDVAGFGLNRAPRVLEVAPLSYSFAERGIVHADIVDAASRVLSVFGYPYMIVGIEVPLKLFDVLLGDTVLLTNAQLPDEEDGTRGFTSAKACMVIGRSWDLDTGRGLLTLMYSQTRVSGYTPAARITSPASPSGPHTNVTLTVTDSDVDGLGTYWPSGADARTFFAVGDEIRVWRWDNATPSAIAGNVTAVTATTVDVSLDSAWTLLAGEVWYLGYGSAALAGLVQGQRLYTFLAGSDMLIDFPSVQPARVYG